MQFMSWWNKFFTKETKSCCKILCIDLDKDFSLSVERVAAPLGIDVDKVNSIASAKKLIEENSSYQAFVIGGLLSDGSGFEMVAWIRESKGLETPIGFVSGIYHDAASFRILKERLKVNYVLDKPLKAKDLALFLQKLCSFEYPQENTYYQQTIVDKVERIEKLIDLIKKTPNLENLENFRREIHKLAGSAGSYGYDQISKQCKHQEIELMTQIELAKESKTDATWMTSLDKFFNELKFNFQLSNHKEIMPSRKIVETKGKILLIDDDRDNNHFFMCVLTNFELQIQILEDSLLIEERLQNYDPHIIFVDIDLSNQKKVELLHFLKGISHKHKFVGMVTAPDEIHLIAKIYNDLFIDILIKPIEQNSLEKIIVSLLREI